MSGPVWLGNSYPSPTTLHWCLLTRLIEDLLSYQSATFLSFSFKWLIYSKVFQHNISGLIDSKKSLFGFCISFFQGFKLFSFVFQLSNHYCKNDNYQICTNDQKKKCLGEVFNSVFVQHSKRWTCDKWHQSLKLKPFDFLPACDSMSSCRQDDIFGRYFGTKICYDNR